MTLNEEGLPPRAMSHDSAARMELFRWLTKATKQLTSLAVGGDREGLQKLDQCLAAGGFVKLEYGVGSAGPLGLDLIAIMPNGERIELLSLTAPANDLAFLFDDE